MTRSLANRLSQVERRLAVPRFHIVAICPNETIADAWLHHPNPYGGLDCQTIFVESEFARQNAENFSLGTAGE